VLINCSVNCAWCFEFTKELWQKLAHLRYDKFLYCSSHFGCILLFAMSWTFCVLWLLLLLNYQYYHQCSRTNWPDCITFLANIMTACRMYKAALSVMIDASFCSWRSPWVDLHRLLSTWNHFSGQRSRTKRKRFEYNYQLFFCCKYWHCKRHCRNPKWHHF